MNKRIGNGQAGIPINCKPHFGDTILEKYGDRIVGGFDDLE
jgi:hypothetical protein